MEWFINERLVTREHGVVKAPFVSNITIDVNNTMELKCTSQNRGGLDVAKIRIVIQGR